MTNYPMGKYNFPKRRNKTYKKRPTKYRRQQNFKEFIIVSVFVVSFSLTQAFLSINNSFEICDNSVKAKAETQLTADSGGAEGDTDILPLAESPDWSTLHYIEKMTPMELWVWEEVEKAGLDPNKAFRVVECESGWQPEASFINQKHNSIDRGLWMINSYYHSEVSPSCAYDYKCSTKHAIRIVKERGWREWVCGIKLKL